MNTHDTNDDLSQKVLIKIPQQSSFWVPKLKVKILLLLLLEKFIIIINNIISWLMFHAAAIVFKEMSCIVLVLQGKQPE